MNHLLINRDLDIFRSPPNSLTASAAALGGKMTINLSQGSESSERQNHKHVGVQDAFGRNKE